MALHKPWDRYFFTKDSAVITVGEGSTTLTKGEFGVFDIWDVGADGSKATATFTAAKTLEFKLGKSAANLSLRSNSDKALSSFPFKIGDITDVGVNRPSSVQKYDKLLVGFNGQTDVFTSANGVAVEFNDGGDITGYTVVVQSTDGATTYTEDTDYVIDYSASTITIDAAEAMVDATEYNISWGDPDTEIVFTPGQNKELSIEIGGKPMGLLGYQDAMAELRVYFTVPNCDPDACVECDDCTAVTGDALEALFTNAVDTFNSMTLIGGVPVNNYVVATKVETIAGKFAIRFVSQGVILAGDDTLRDEMPFLYTSCTLSVAGGFPTEVNENFVTTKDRFTVTLIEKREDLTNLGGNFWDLEDRNRVYFDDSHRHSGQHYAKWALGEESNLDATTQYNDFWFTVRRNTNSQGFSKESAESITYHIIADVAHSNSGSTDIEALLDALAVAAGFDGVIVA